MSHTGTGSGKRSEQAYPITATVVGAGGGALLAWIWGGWFAPPDMTPEVAAFVAGILGGILGPLYRRYLRLMNK